MPVMKKRWFAAVLMAPVLLPVTSACAMGLLQAYERALQNDPTYYVAVHEHEAGQEYRVLGRANLLPNVAITYQSSRNRADITSPNLLGKLTTTQPQYSSTAGALSLRQPIFNVDGVARYRQGIAQTHYSDALFSGQMQGLILRVVGAYVEAKFAEDQLALMVAQRDTLAEQKRINERMFERGEATKTDMLETQAKYDVASAQMIEAQDNVQTARDTLASIVGGDVMHLDALPDNFRVKSVALADFEAWKALALAHNTDIVAQRYAVEAAQQEVNRARAGHVPRLDLVASYGKNDSESVTTVNQESTVRSIGVQLSIPLYAGGSVSAATRQAVANYEKAKSELEAKTGQLLVELKKQYNLVLSSATKMEALMTSVESADLLVQATRQSIKGGVRINLDLLNAQQQLFAARRDLAQARYSYVLSDLRMRNAAGTLSVDDLRTMAAYFVAS